MGNRLGEDNEPTDGERVDDSGPEDSWVGKENDGAHKDLPPRLVAKNTIPNFEGGAEGWRSVVLLGCFWIVKVAFDSGSSNWGSLSTSKSDNWCGDAGTRGRGWCNGIGVSGR